MLELEFVVGDLNVGASNLLEEVKCWRFEVVG